jgi:hypothetical protein
MPLSVRISSVAASISARVKTRSSPRCPANSIDARDVTGARHRGASAEKGFVVQLEKRKIDVGRDGHDRGRNLVARVVGLDLDLAGIVNDVGVGQEFATSSQKSVAISTSS